MRGLKLGVAGVLALLAIASPASAEFGFDEIDVSFVGPDGSPSMQAGSHPYATDVSLDVVTVEDGGGEYVDGALRDLEVLLPAGVVGDPKAVPSCGNLDFLAQHPSIGGLRGNCPDSSAIGLVYPTLGTNGTSEKTNPLAVYNLTPPPGVAAKLGFWVGLAPITIEVSVNPDPPHNVVSTLSNASQFVEVFASELIIWGVPADDSHDAERGVCISPNSPKESCPADIPVKPFLTLPRSCTGPLTTVFKATSWWSGSPFNPGPPASFAGTAITEDELGNPLGTVGCSKLSFEPQVSSHPTTTSASSASGLEFDLSVEDEGITNPTGLAHSDIKRVEVSLPKGMTLNPSQAEGLAACSEAQLAQERPDSEPGEGCPQASKVGSLEVETPILEGTTLKGEVFVATPYENLADDSLIALYLVIKNRELGVVVRQAGRVEPDLETGQLKTILEDLPQFPLGKVSLKLREGARSPLVTPPTCDGDPSQPGNQPYTTVAKFTPWANPASTFTATSQFQITQGPNGAPCREGGMPPFEPGFAGGTVNNAAGKFSPFLLQLTRRDGDQDLVRFDSTLPPGALARLAGVARCPEADIARIETRSGKEELASSACPAASKIGSVQAGAGVGSQVIYVPGSVYLAGPFAGAPLSIVGVVPAVAGPFDVGVIATRQALTLDPITGIAKVDGTKSEPIPHILAGIPLKVRDIRVAVDRPDFTFNPTNCSPLSFGASLWGGGGDPFDPADDTPVSRSERFQAADCASLGFKPKLALNLKGATKRGKFPALTTVLTPRAGDANLEGLSLRLPRSAFLEQGHFRTICTRVQFAAGAGGGEQCPPGSVYGKVKAFTPILDEPAEGNVYLRSSSHDLPDIVLALKGPPSAAAKVEVTARVDSHKGGIRVTVKDVPDLPVSKAIVTMQGGQKGLIVNSRDLCAKASKADTKFSAQNGKRLTAKTLVKAKGCKGKKRSSKGKRRGKR